MGSEKKKPRSRYINSKPCTHCTSDWSFGAETKHFDNFIYPGMSTSSEPHIIDWNSTYTSICVYFLKLSNMFKIKHAWKNNVGFMLSLFRMKAKIVLYAPSEFAIKHKQTPDASANYYCTAPYVLHLIWFCWAALAKQPYNDIEFSSYTIKCKFFNIICAYIQSSAKYVQMYCRMHIWVIA